MNNNNSWYWDQEWNDFRRGETMAKIKWDGGEAKVLLYNEGVSKTVEAIRRLPSLKIKVVHVAWSGEMLMSAESYDIGANEMENSTRLVQPGDLTWDPKFGELGFVYGPAECKLPSGPNTVVVFGKVIDNFEAYLEFCRKRRFEGASVIELINDF